MKEPLFYLIKLRELRDLQAFQTNQIFSSPILLCNLIPKEFWVCDNLARLQT